MGYDITPSADANRRRSSEDSLSSTSTTSLVFERLEEHEAEKAHGALAGGRFPHRHPRKNATLDDNDPLADDDEDLETARFLAPGSNIQRHGMDRSLRRILWIAGSLIVGAWIAVLVTYAITGSYKHASQTDADPTTSALLGSGKPVTLDQVLGGDWYAKNHDIKWIAGPNGEDGLLLLKGAADKDFLVVEDVRASTDGSGLSPNVASSVTLIKSKLIKFGDKFVVPTSVWPSKDLTKVLIASSVEKNWRHSFSAIYWIFDVASQTVEPLDPLDDEARVQLATFSPKNDAVIYTRDNNLYLRRLSGSLPNKKVSQITKDGGSEYFYGIPDWVYEEEVFGGNSATWWSEDGNYVAFLRTNESGVPEYPVQYFISRPSGTEPYPGEEAYPEVRQIKYPKAGAHNPVVDLLFYDIQQGDVFSVDIQDGFSDDDRLITSVTWAGGRVIVKETNRVSNVMRVVLIDVAKRSGKTVHTIDVGKIDGGWFEISNPQYIPADPAHGRLEDGYVDSVIHDNGDHLAYFAPLDNPNPIMLTSGPWEVVDGPASIDLTNNLVYFVSTKDGSTQRHIYSVRLDGTGMVPVTSTSETAYYTASFSHGSGYALLSYKGPKIPWQQVISTPSNPTQYQRVIEENTKLAELARGHQLPILVHGTIEVDGIALNYVERRPPNFDASRKYPVLFYQYSGPGSQQVSQRFAVDFQSYVASSLGYIVVTVDGRGTGYIGRSARVVVRGKLGYWESHDQIEAAKAWAAQPYVDASRLAIWGWSFGGFTTLKTLEQDAGRTFSYGMAVAPVTDWRYYDSIYTERYMDTPQNNRDGYELGAVQNASALGENVRFLLMHGVADDNVHMQNSLTLLDRLDVAGVENYDVHVFPDSDHGIYFHNANRIVYDKLSNWLINAFNGEWLKVSNATPKTEDAVAGG